MLQSMPCHLYPFNGTFAKVLVLGVLACWLIAERALCNDAMLNGCVCVPHSVCVRGGINLVSLSSLSTVLMHVCDLYAVVWVFCELPSSIIVLYIAWAVYTAASSGAGVS
jgi:hypothetical protein